MANDKLMVTVQVKSSETVEVMSLHDIRELTVKVANDLNAGLSGLWKIGQNLVFQFYGKPNQQQDVADCATEVINMLPQSARAGLYHWLKRAGINAASPLPGTTRYEIGGVLDFGFQGKAFAYIRTTPPLAIETKVAKEKKVKDLPQDSIAGIMRAREAFNRTLANLKKNDPAGAAAFNEMLQQHSECYFDSHGVKHGLTKDELRHIGTMIGLIADCSFKGFLVQEQEGGETVQLPAMQLAA